MDNDQTGLNVDNSQTHIRRRATLALAGGALVAVLGLGAAATVFAADPSPSPSTGTQASPAPQRTDRGPGAGTGAHRNCPEDGQSGGSGQGGSGQGGQASPQPSETGEPSGSPET